MIIATTFTSWLACPGTLYTGVTNNACKAGIGCEFTSRYKVDRLVWYEPFQYVNNAINREKEIQGWRRSKKVSLIESMNPSWRDMSKDFGMEYKPEKLTSG